MTESKITSIVVIYNKELCTTSICLRIKKYSDVIVVDNSTKETDNKNFCSEHGISYISMGGNKGLSKAYNAAIDQIGNTDVVAIFDDDTEVPDEYFIKLKKALMEEPDVDIFAPIIRGQDGVIYSPNNYRFFKNELVKDPQRDVKQERFNAISSCMAIRKRVFNNYRYNEKLFVDEIDHCFCRDQRERGCKFQVLDIKISQNFHQRVGRIDPEGAWRRVKIRIVDIFQHARLIGKKKYVLQAFLKCCGIALQMGNKSKSIIVTLKVIGLSVKMVFYG